MVPAPVTSYPPALVKRSIVGGGRAAKGQVQRVVQMILKLPQLPQEDEADALAILHYVLEEEVMP